MPPTDVDSLLLRATALDSRHKEAKFLTEDIWASLKLALSLEQPQKGCQQREALQAEPAEESPAKKAKLDTGLQLLFCKTQKMVSQTTNEVDQYRQEPAADLS